MTPAEVGTHASATAAKLMNKRSLGWLRKHTTTVGAQKKAVWMPRRRYRLGAEKWLKMKDNMVRVCTSWAGIRQCVRLRDDESWSDENWRRWDHLALAQDRGSDGCCAVHALLHWKDANVTAYWDEHHDLDNDVYGAYKDVKCYPFVMVLCCVHNLLHGHDRDKDVRLYQMKECMSTVFSQFTHEDNSSFQEKAHTMLEELGADLPDLASTDEPAVKVLWDYGKAKEETATVREVVNLIRFLSWPAAGKRLLKEWTYTLWKLEHLCIEMGFLSGTALRHKIAVKAQHLQAAEATQSTDPSIPRVDGQILRSSCQNAAVVSLMLLDDPQHRRLLAHLIYPVKPLLVWRGEYTRFAKSASETQAWQQRSNTGAFVDVLRDVLSTLQDPAALKDMAYEFRSADGPADDATVILVEDEWANMLGFLCLRLLGRRLKRRLFMWGWPHRFVEATDLESLQVVMREFRMDYDAYVALQGQPANAPQHATFCALKDRSQFGTVAVQQFLAGCKASSWVATRDILELADEHTSIVDTTIWSEYLVGYGKNSRKVRGAQTYRRPDMAYAVQVGSDMTTKRGRFEKVDEVEAPARKTARLSGDAFFKAPVECTLNLKGLASNTAKAPFYSPVGLEIGANVADHCVLTHCNQYNCWGDLANDVSGIMADGHPFVFKRKASEADG